MTVTVVPSAMLGRKTSSVIKGLIQFRTIDSAEANADTSLAAEDGESVAVVYAGDHGGEFSGNQTRNCEDDEKLPRWTAIEADRALLVAARRPWPVVWSRLLNVLHRMKTIQVVLDRKLLQAADRAARRTRQNRSALIRDALRRHLRSLEIRELEQRDRQRYTTLPQPGDESGVWEAEATWPGE